MWAIWRQHQYKSRKAEAIINVLGHPVAGKYVQPNEVHDCAGEQRFVVLAIKLILIIIVIIEIVSLLGC